MLWSSSSFWEKKWKQGPEEVLTHPRSWRVLFPAANRGKQWRHGWHTGTRTDIFRLKKEGKSGWVKSAIHRRTHTAWSHGQDQESHIHQTGSRRWWGAARGGWWGSVSRGQSVNWGRWKVLEMAVGTTAQQCEGAYCHWAGHWKMVTVVSFLCILPQLK